MLLQHISGKERVFDGFGWEAWGGKRPLGNPVVDGRMILKCIFRKWDVEEWTGSSWLMMGTVGGHLRRR